MDYKEWIQQRADELAQENFNKDYFSLADNIQFELYRQAESEYKNNESARIDAAYDAALERRLMEKWQVDE